MAVTSATAKRFLNERARPTADALAQAYYALKSLSDEWHAKGIDALVLPGSGDIEKDPEDTRDPVSSDDIIAFLKMGEEILAQFEGNGFAQLYTILRIAVNPAR